MSVCPCRGVIPGGCRWEDTGMDQGRGRQLSLPAPIF